MAAQRVEEDGTTYFVKSLLPNSSQLVAVIAERLVQDLALDTLSDSEFEAQLHDLETLYSPTFRLDLV